ncbi:unnamed protein product [Gongylonema pulchrum]|uniref:Uncharacterized protein n=1 Tax=Gongylonema pulchrum TaxID=637853 RepID=A0A183EXC0_9BILA|nr:unnamed protein product [Gongylonema pulchrum]
MKSSVLRSSQIVTVEARIFCSIKMPVIYTYKIYRMVTMDAFAAHERRVLHAASRRNRAGEIDGKEMK